MGAIGTILVVVCLSLLLAGICVGSVWLFRAGEGRHTGLRVLLRVKSSITQLSEGLFTADPASFNWVIIGFLVFLLGGLTSLLCGVLGPLYGVVFVASLAFLPVVGLLVLKVASAFARRKEEIRLWKQLRGEPVGMCPKCGSGVFGTPKCYSCERCRFTIDKVILEQSIDKAAAAKLLGERRSMLFILSKTTSKPFPAFLVLGDDGGIKTAPPFSYGADYPAYLASEHWQTTRRGALQRAAFACQKCNGKTALEVHHHNYHCLGKELPEDLVVLCRACHAEVHKI